MATLAVQAGGVLIAFALGWVGVQGLRGKPDTTGEVTSKPTAVACLVLALVLGIAALAAPYLM